MTPHLYFFILPLLLFHNCLADEPPPRGHKCHLEDIRLDLVFVFDSSSGTDSFGFAGQKAAILGLLRELPIGQRPKETRVAFVNLGNERTARFNNLTTFFSSQAATTALLQMPLLNEQLNVKRGLSAGWQEFKENDAADRKDIPNVMILFSSTNIDCDKMEPNNQYQSCILAETIKNESIYLVSVELRYHEDRYERPMKLGDISLSNNETFLDDLEGVLCSKSPFDPPELSPNACPCILSGLWLDIIIMFDSSQGAGVMGFNAQKAAIVGFLHQIFVNQKAGKFSRLAFINVGENATYTNDLKHYNYAVEAIDDLVHLQFQNTGKLNLQAGFEAAKKIFMTSDARSNAKNVLVVFTTATLDCSHDSPACRPAIQLRDDKVVVLSVDVTLSTTERRSTFGSECFRMSNSLWFLEKFEDLMCKANCFCIPPTIQFKDEHDCGIYGQCVYLEETPAPVNAAKIGCGLSKMTLTDVYSDAKDIFLTGIARDEGVDRYAIGLEDVNGDLQWSSGETMGKDDFNLFGPGEPDPRHGNCTFVDLAEGKQSVWKTMFCSYLNPSMKYFCQKNTCDTGHYCANIDGTS